MSRILDAGHPEQICRRCGGANVGWRAPSPLWNQVMRGDDINGEELLGGIVCPTCFAILAERAGIAMSWRLEAQRVHVELATTTPSGRVWNPQTWLWEPPSSEAGKQEPQPDHQDWINDRQPS